MAINSGNKGLLNLGNTCYMNSVLQCLSHLLIFHPMNELFYEECKELKEGLMYEWVQFQKNMWSNENNTVQNPIQLLKSFKRICSEKDLYFENFNQNDVDEFLVLFLDLLHQCIRKRVKIKLNNMYSKNENSKIIIKGYETWKRFYEKDYSYIVENFYSQLLSITICPECYYFTTNHDPIQVISLEIPSSAKSLDDCFQNYTKKIVLDEQNMWKCDKCCKQVRPHKKTLFFKTSDILIILLKRFTKYGTKIDRYLEYPMKLNLKDYNKNYGTQKKNIYQLNGICIHNGVLGGGHYYAVSKNVLDSQWRKYNDSEVSKIKVSEVTQLKPYLFFYKRI
ncbi:MAG: hypothetical protein CMD29_03245 [Flavobacteriales bacterium]|nr:hypothetical protein [Flavobacteriales bacterium]|tara:strand:+ start:290 stop:1297 length:1008 start_codon:yes stop_codon:yes gene_type:complete